MIAKIALTVFACSAAAFVAGSQGRIVYSPYQSMGSAEGYGWHYGPSRNRVKTIPDPACVWSWHETIRSFSSTSVPVFVDIDGNGEMDTNNPFVRVIITDIQAVSRLGGEVPSNLVLSDSQGPRWSMRPESTSHDPNAVAYHLTTPIVLPVGSGLTVDFSPKAGGGTASVSVNLIGRVVNL